MSATTTDVLSSKFNSSNESSVDGTFNMASHSKSVNKVVLNVNGHRPHSFYQYDAFNS